MPLWNICLSGMIAGYQIRSIVLHRQSIQHIISTHTAAPVKYTKMMRKLARKMNIRNPGAIQMVLHDDANCSAEGIRIFGDDKFVVKFPRAVCDEQFARTNWENFQKLCDGDGVELSVKEAKDVKTMFGVNVPRNVNKFNIAHELAHVKHNDSLRGDLVKLSWQVLTLWPATNLVVEKVPQLLSQGILKLDFIASVIDPLLFLQAVGVSSLWLVSYGVMCQLERRLKFRQEFRADRTAAEIDADTASGGLAFLTAEKNFNVQCLRTTANAHLRKEYDDEGNHIKSPSHPITGDRIKALEKILEMHNAKEKSDNV